MTLYACRCRACGWRVPAAPLGQATAAAILHTESSSKTSVFTPTLRRGHTVLVEWGERGEGARYVVRGFFRVRALKESQRSPLPET